MKKMLMIAAVALAPVAATAGNPTPAGTQDELIVAPVIVTEAPGSIGSAGSLGSLGGTGAIIVGILGLAAVLAAAGVFKGTCDTGEC